MRNIWKEGFSPAVSVHKEPSHETGKPCLNFSFVLSDDVNNDDAIVTIIINHSFYAQVDEPAETVVRTKQFRLPLSKDLRHKTS